MFCKRYWRLPKSFLPLNIITLNQDNFVNVFALLDVVLKDNVLGLMQ